MRIYPIPSNQNVAYSMHHHSEKSSLNLAVVPESTATQCILSVTKRWAQNP